MTFQNKLAQWISGNHGNSKHQKSKLKWFDKLTTEPDRRANPNDPNSKYQTYVPIVHNSDLVIKFAIMAVSLCTPLNCMKIGHGSNSGIQEFRVLGIE